MGDTFSFDMDVSTTHLISSRRSGKTEMVNTIMALPQDKVDEFIARMSDRAHDLTLGSFDYMKNNLKLRWGVSVHNFRNVPKNVEKNIVTASKVYAPESLDSSWLERMANSLIQEHRGWHSSINHAVFHLLADDPDVQEVMYYDGEKWAPPGQVTLSISEILAKGKIDED